MSTNYVVFRARFFEAVSSAKNTATQLDLISQQTNSDYENVFESVSLSKCYEKHSSEKRYKNKSKRNKKKILNDVDLKNKKYSTVPNLA
jgi:hypothetical protein